MVKAAKAHGLSPEQAARIQAAQERHTALDPGCEALSPEECIRWHPVNGMTWEERAEAMREAGVVDPGAAEPLPARAIDTPDWAAVG